MKLIYKCSPYMLNIRINFVFVVLFFCNFSVLAVTYTYNGPNFQFVSGPYATSNNISGYLETDQELAPNLQANVIVEPILNYEFTDGVQVFDPTNSILVFAVETDENSKIQKWALSITELPSPMAAGDAYHVLGSYYFVDWRDSSLDGECLDFGQVCLTIGNYLGSGNFSTSDPILLSQAPASWSVEGLPPEIVPSTTIYSLVVLILLIGFYSYFYMQRSLLNDY